MDNISLTLTLNCFQYQFTCSQYFFSHSLTIDFFYLIKTAAPMMATTTSIERMIITAMADILKPNLTNFKINIFCLWPYTWNVISNKKIKCHSWKSYKHGILCLPLKIKHTLSTEIFASSEFLCAFFFHKKNATNCC